MTAGTCSGIARRIGIGLMLVVPWVEGHGCGVGEDAEFRGQRTKNKLIGVIL